jgi:hypothetical protein
MRRKVREGKRGVAEEIGSRAGGFQAHGRVVIARSEAKQQSRLLRRLDCFASLAMMNE